MKLDSVRIAFKQTYTISRLSVNGVYLCDILEDVDRDKNKDGDLNDIGEAKVYGETAIPRGTYNVILTYSNRFKKILPLLEDVPGFEGIRIHSGNSAQDSSGCLLVGKNTIIGKVVDSKKWFDKLMVMLRDAYEMKETITITIS